MRNQVTHCVRRPILTRDAKPAPQKSTRIDKDGTREAPPFMVQKKSKKIDKADFPYICKKGDHRKKKFDQLPMSQ